MTAAALRLPALVIALVAAACCASASAQTIYKSPGTAGPVYSDTPSPQGRPLDLPPPNIAQPPPKPAPAAPDAEPGAAQKAGARPQAAPYRSFRITKPEDMGSAAASTSNFEIRVAVDPPLQTTFGHAFAVTLNGRPVDKRYIFNEMLIPPEFFGGVIEVNQHFRAEAFIVDQGGKVLMTAQPVEFTMRHMPARPRRR
jgi:hypothetical protein